jgi:hypothetical protein
MKQPTITLDGVKYNVASVWWNEKGKLSHLAYRVGESEVETIFGDDYYLGKLIEEE